MTDVYRLISMFFDCSSSTRFFHPLHDGVDRPRGASDCFMMWVATGEMERKNRWLKAVGRWMWVAPRTPPSFIQICLALERNLHHQDLFRKSQFGHENFKPVADLSLVGMLRKKHHHSPGDFIPLTRGFHMKGTGAYLGVGLLGLSVAAMAFDAKISG